MVAAEWPAFQLGSVVIPQIDLAYQPKRVSVRLFSSVQKPGANELRLIGDFCSRRNPIMEIIPFLSNNES